MDRLTTSLSSIRDNGVVIWVDNDQLRYRAPRGALSAEQIALLREMKDEIITLLSERPTLFTSAKASVYQSTCDVAPLGLQQEFYLSMVRGHDRSSDTLVPVIVPIALRISGPLDTNALSNSLNAMIRRHESLRTRIVLIGGVPMQKIDEPAEFRLPIVDCAGSSMSEIEGNAQRIVKEFFNRPTDLQVGPTFDGRLIRLAKHEYVLALAWDHLTNDSSSLVLLFRELWRLYGDIVLGRNPALDKMPPQYADYAVWQRKAYRRWLHEHDGYWREKLSEAVPITMPVDTGLANVEPCTGAVMRFSFGKVLSDALHNLARDNRTLPGMILLTIYATAVFRICQQRDFVIPFCVTGRRYPEDSEVIGSFAHQLLLRIRMTGNEAFSHLLRIVSNEFLLTNEHLDYGRNYDQKPLCHGMMLIWYPWSSGVIMEGQSSESQRGLSISPFQTQSAPDLPTSFKTSECFRWALTLENRPEGIFAMFSYRADLYALDTMRRFVKEILEFAEHVVANARAPVASFH